MRRIEKPYIITINQRRYIEEVLKRFNIEECKHVETPFNANSKLLSLLDEEFRNVQKEMKGVSYKAGVGSLIYAMVATRANITFVMNTVSQFILKAGPPHWIAVKHIMRYLKGTLDFILCLRGKDIALRLFCDADWVGGVNDWRSITGYVFFIGVGVISWKCKKQPTIALSTMEAEHMATSHCTNKIVWLIQLLADVGYMQEGPTSIMCDNLGCIALAKNPTHHSHTEHFDVQHHFINEKT